MWGLILTIFLILFILICYYIGRKGWKVFVNPSSRLSKTLYFIIYFSLILPFPMSELLEPFLPETIASWLTIFGGHTMIAVLYIFFITLLLDICRLIDRWWNYLPKQMKEHQKTPIILATLVILIAFGSVAYGSWNARNPVIKKYEIAIQKEVNDFKQLRVAMVSDIHYGPVVDEERVKQLKKMIDDIKPDLILIAGDITDGPLYSKHKQILASALGELKAPLGIFAVPGNHDRDMREKNSELNQLFEKAGIRVLKDETVLIQNSFYLIGRDDLSLRRKDPRQELSELMKEVDTSKPIILLDHQPVDLAEARTHGIDLQLSGHTHNGQIFPANLITAMIYEIDWGLLKKGPYHLIVSCGFGTWGPPLRIGNQPEVVDITIHFQ